jgi:uncharacterized protein YerC
MSKPQDKKEIQIPQELLKELLTDSEWRMLEQRFQIIKLIVQGESVRKIATKVGVGTDTVMRMTRKLEKNEVLKKAFLEREPSPAQSKWVFGQISSEEVD